MVGYRRWEVQSLILIHQRASCKHLRAAAETAIMGQQTQSLEKNRDFGVREDSIMWRCTAYFRPLASLVLLGLVSGCGDKPDPPEPETKAELVLEDQKIHFAGQEIKIPCKLRDLEAVLGKSTAQHEYRSAKNEPAQTVHVWDDRGIYCFVRPDRSVVSQLSFALARREKAINPRESDEFWPKSNYQGGIRFERAKIAHNTTPMAVNDAQGRDDFVKNPHFPFRWNASFRGKTIAIDTDSGGKTILEFSIGK